MVVCLCIRSVTLPVFRTISDVSVLASEAYGEMVIYDTDTNVPFPFGDNRLDLIKAGHTSEMMAKESWTTTLFRWLRDGAKNTGGLREIDVLKTEDMER